MHRLYLSRASDRTASLPAAHPARKFGYYTRRDVGDEYTRKAATGINVVSLANNHTLDYGSAALLDTLRRLDAVGVAHAGAGTNRQAARETDETFILEVTIPPNGPPTVAAVPVYLKETTGVPSPVEGQAADVILGRLTRLSKNLGWNLKGLETGSSMNPDQLPSFPRYLSYVPRFGPRPEQNPRA
ncbi:MAG: CapA family protein, partial [Thermoleophilia bacterium]|nr:CapA family protein [Thermoleophilia bacterium]